MRKLIRAGAAVLLLAAAGSTTISPADVRDLRLEHGAILSIAVLEFEQSRAL